jgi:diguanylate cyclase (GGDEF)-like protein
MRGFMTPDVVANTVSMMRADVDGALWLSNDHNDGRFYEKCKHPDSRIWFSDGIALNILDIVNSRGIDGVVATIQELRGVEDLPDNVFMPEVGDAISLILLFNGCDEALKVITGSNWYLASEKIVGSLTRRAISIICIYNRVCEIEAVKSTIPPIGEMINWDTFNFPSTMSMTNADNILRHIEGLWPIVKEMATRDMLMECKGVDVVSLITQALVRFKPRGVTHNVPINFDNVLGMLIGHFNFSVLESDKMYWRMREWERRHKSFPLLQSWRLLDPFGVVLNQCYWESDLKFMLNPDISKDGLSAFKMDLDNFKQVNEKLGHTLGDEAIRIYCEIVKSVFWHVGEIYRRGGDEVVVLCPSIRESEAKILAENVRSRIEIDFSRWGSQHGLAAPPTVSIGIVDVEPGCAYENVIGMMDETQQQAKLNGKNRFEFMECRPV